MFRSLVNSIKFYGCVLLSPQSPGTLAWTLFKGKRGKVPLIKRDLICDTDTLMALPKNEIALDEFTTAFSPFIPLLTLNGSSWKERRAILGDGLRKMQLPPDISFSIPYKQGDIYWDIFENFFMIGFELIFGRSPSLSDCQEMYPGVRDINRLIKRQVRAPDMDVRWNLYHHVVKLLAENNPKFIYYDHKDFQKLDEINRVSILVEDILTSICIQCSDLTCHLLLLYPQHEEAFKANLDNCINETLRLYPLTDIWTRKTQGHNRGWIASLVQLNRTGWDEPDLFKPERWNQNHHPPLISWGFDSRGCPASKIAYSLVKVAFQKIALVDQVWITPAANFQHGRTFIDGCQVRIGKGPQLSNDWKFKGKFKSQFLQWYYSRVRLLDQHELW